MVTKALYIDDEISKPGRDADKVKELLAIPGEFECKLILPPQNFDDFPNEEVDVFLIDHELNTDPPDPDGKPVNYFGLTLASEMRLRYPNRPIILISKKIEDWQRQLFEENSAIDLIILKQDIYANEHRDGERKKIIELARGFSILSTKGRQDWQGVLDLMVANKDEANILREAAPPVIHKQWNVSQTAKWILDVVIRFPGILYNDLYAATRLGISLTSFHMQKVQDLFREAKYTGLFSRFEDHWWRDRLFNEAHRLMQKHELKGSVSQNFSKAFKLEFKEELEPAICIYDGTPIADWVCYILQKPVKQQNSIPYYPDRRPKVMDQARVSFRAIKEEDEFDERLVDSDSDVLVKKLMTGA